MGKTEYTIPSYVAKFGKDGRITLRVKKRYPIEDPLTECDLFFLAEFFAGEVGLDIVPEEYVYLAALDPAMHLKGITEISHGGLDGSFTDMKAVFIKALLMNASCIAIIHNHPSCDPTPSKPDIELTEKIKKVAEMLDITFLDHIIIGAAMGGKTRFFSYRADKELVLSELTDGEPDDGR